MTQYARGAHTADALAFDAWTAGARPDWLPPVHRDVVNFADVPENDAAETMFSPGEAAAVPCLYIQVAQHPMIFQPGTWLVRDQGFGLIVVSDELFAAKWSPIP